MSPDSDLLRHYVSSRDEESFAALVRTYLPLIYSAALRRTGGRKQLAEEVAMGVFTKLAQSAERLLKHTSLVGWLYTTTHHLAAKALRGEQRRIQREQEAFLMNESSDGENLDWEKLSPVLDEAMLSLKESDRTALLLRFFENKAYAEIGEKLGLSENTTRMRVDRALNALRAVLARRGITSTASALGTALVAHATVAVPQGLIAAATSAGAVTVSSGILVLLMSSTLLKTTIAATLVVGAGAGLFWQNHELSKLRAQNTELQATVARMQATAKTTANLGSEVSRLQGHLTQLQQTPAASWMERVNQLKRLFTEVPETAIPEMALLTEEDWLDASREEFKTVEELRLVTANVRNAAIERFCQLARIALAKYVEHNKGAFPKTALELQPYLEKKIDEAILTRYEAVDASSVPNIRLGKTQQLLKLRSVVDEDYDNSYYIAPNSTGSRSSNNVSIDSIVMAYMAANPGKKMPELEDLRPYAKSNAEKAEIEKIIRLKQRAKQ